MQKYGKKNNIQRYFCSSCHKAFSFTKKLNSIDIWTDYTIGKQTYKKSFITVSSKQKRLLLQTRIEHTS
ncbi:transposase-like zinc-binding domain-containing protein [Glaesserella parasuis]|uniref:transposase-like zinc-binding domain-containing protein n=1 Tax=Glaesserella parasuis TaxID=738 RepID=UPI003C6FF1D0